MLKRHSILYLVLYLLCPVAGVAQSIAFHHLTVENGLSQNAVLAVSQDEKGFIWIGTSNGLNRYDGYRFRIYQSRQNDSSTLTNNNILSILNDSRNQMWVGTYFGLNKYDAALDRFQRIPSPRDHQLSFASIFEDRSGRLWVGTNEGLYNMVNDRLIAVDFPKSSGVASDVGVRSIAQDRNGHIWIGTIAGLLQLPNGQTQGMKVFRHNPADASTLSADLITGIEEDRFGRIWAATLNNGLNMLEPGTDRFRRFLHINGQPSLINNNVRKILLDKSGLLWIGTQEGISVLDENLRFVYSFQQKDGDPHSLSHNSVHCLYQDMSGNIWTGTYFGGLNYTYAVNTEFAVLRKKDAPNFLSNNVISSITEDEKKNLWIGTEGGGLNYYDRSNGRFTSYKHNAADPLSIGSNLIKVVYRDREGNIWCGTHGGGLNHLDPATRSFRRYLFKENDATTLNSEVLSVFEDSRGRFWVGSTLGIKLFNKTTHGLEPVNNTFTQSAPFGSTASYFYEDDKRRLWIGTSDGLYLLTNETFQKISNEQVNCILQDRRSQIWMGMRQSGLTRYNENTHSLDYVSQDNKLNTRNIMGILEDQQGHLWMSSDNGLLKFNPAQDQLQIFTVSDGIAGNAFNFKSFFKDDAGEFFFGGFNGITHFFPERIQSNQKVPRLVLTDLRLFNEPVKPGDQQGLLPQSISHTAGVTLRYNQNMVGIDFAVLNHIKSNKNSYAYKLEGYDKAWNFTGTPAVNYANLPPGQYTFLVKGANNDGIWSDPVSFKITVLPPFWLTWWAYCIYILAIAGVVFLIVRYFFLGALLKKEEELHHVKLNFFTNISHEIRTHLTLITAPVDRMLESQETNHFVRQQLGAVQQNANRLLRLVNELMDFRKAETGNMKLYPGKHDIIAFLEEIYVSVRDACIHKNITLSFVQHTDAIAVYFDREQLEKVFINLLTNAIRFTPQNGTITLEIKDAEKEVIVAVTDNGRGIAPEYLDKVFTNFFQVADHGVQNTGYGIGLALARTIISLHHGSIVVESVPATDNQDGRTTFRVTLPKGYSHFDTDQLKWIDEPVRRPSVSLVDPIDLDTEVADNFREKTGNTILIVEDNISLRALVRDTFADKYRVLEAGDGVQGLELARTEIPDLIISDVMMPEMEGVEMCYRLKTDTRTSHIPVILLTAKGTQNDKVSGLENGADLYVTKPFSTKVLELNVRNLLLSRERLREHFQKSWAPHPAPPSTPAADVPAPNTTEQAYLLEVVQFIEENLDNPEFGVDMLSRHLAMSVPVLYKKIKAVTNMSVNDFIKSIRLKKAAELLRGQQLNVNEVAAAVGYYDRKYFSQEFKKQYGKNPREYIQDHKPIN
jgi:ligand-binding sensor domain-containing protein/signal transduction histidine kinase/DNA-binding response OmpR family regulator